MNNDEKERFAKMWTAAFEMYGKTATTGMLQLVWGSLQRFELSDIQRALTAHINNPESGQFPPKPADIVKYIEGSSETRSMLAWTKVMKAVRSVGSYEDVIFDDPIIHAVIRDMGGWVDLCSMYDKDVPFKAREFSKRYEGFSINGGVSDYPKSLAGISNSHNAQANQKLAPPVVVGNEALALEVFNSGGDSSIIKRDSGLIAGTFKKLT